MSRIFHMGISWGKDHSLPATRAQADHDLLLWSHRSHERDFPQLPRVAQT